MPGKNYNYSMGGGRSTSVPTEDRRGSMADKVMGRNGRMYNMTTADLIEQYANQNRQI